MQFLRATGRAASGVASVISLPIRTTLLAVAQSLLGPTRWNILQLLITLSGPPPFPLPLSVLLRLPPLLPLPCAVRPPLARGVAFIRPLRAPLIATWVYGVAARVVAPIHRRSLSFWRRVIPIYSAYKRTQVSLALCNADARTRERVWNVRHKWGATKVYNLCVELRGFYLKDGQFLGSRPDVVPAAWCEQLRLLQDCVPPVPFSQIQKTIRREYRINSLAQIFAHVDEQPLASATIAQVHRCEMRDGTIVALKTQYADQERLCRMDLVNLKRLAAYLQKFDMSFFDMQSVVREFERQIPAEFDFLREAEMMTTIRHNLKRARLTDLVIPRVVPGLVSRRALTMTFIDGCRADNNAALELWGINPYDVVKTVGRAYGQMLLVDGVVHCDPHLGNLIILRDKRVALIDFGQSKELSDDLRHKLCTFYLSLTSKKPQFLGKAMTDLGIELDVDAVNISKAKLLALLPIYANGLLDTAPLPAEVDINPFSEKSPLQQLPIQKFNSDLFMVLRTLGLLRALTQTLDVHRPDCVMSTIFRPFALSGLGHKRNDAPTPAASRTGTGKGGPEVVSRDFVAGKSGMGDADGVGAGGVEQQRRRVALRAALTTGVSSPFDSVDGVGGAIAERCSVA